MPHWPALEGDYPSAAFDYNFGRSWQVNDETRRVPPSLDGRVLALLTGSWMRSGSGCNPLRTHSADCPHQYNAVPYSAPAIARLLWGTAGGSQIRLVRESLKRLQTRELAFRPRLKYPERTARILSLTELPPALEQELPARPEGIVAFCPNYFDGLMAGQIQVIPTALVQGDVSSVFPIWLAALCQYRRSAPSGSEWTWWVTGATPWLPRWRLGLGSLSPAELLGSLKRAAAAGNAAQDRYVLSVTTVPARGRRHKPFVALTMRDGTTSKKGGTSRRAGGTKTEKAYASTLYRQEEDSQRIADFVDEVRWDDGGHQGLVRAASDHGVAAR